jgi:single-strand DNA-binding protein
MSINRNTIDGNLTADPEIRSTADGTSVLSFSVAVNDRRKNRSTGQWESVPNYLDCVIFGARADALSKRLGKGTYVAVSGRNRYSTWERDGQKHSKIEIIVEDLTYRNAKSSGVEESLMADEDIAF